MRRWGFSLGQLLVWVLDRGVEGFGELCAFAVVIMLGQFSPGPDLLLLTRTALREGRAAGLRMAAGIACGLAVHATIAVAGMALVFDRWPVLRRVLQWAAAFYLLWLALGMLRAVLRPGHEVAPVVSPHPPFVRGLFCNLLNPKVALFLAAACAPFLSGNHPVWWPAAIWGLIVGLGIGLWCLWVVLLEWRPLRLRYERSARMLDGIFSLVLAALAIRLMIGW